MVTLKGKKCNYLEIKHEAASLKLVRQILEENDQLFKKMKSGNLKLMYNGKYKMYVF